MFFYLECDRLPGHLQEMDGLAQWLSFKTDPTDGQDSVPYMYGPSPAGFGEQRRQRYQNIPDSTGRRDGKPVRLPVCWLRQKQRGFLLQKKTRQLLFTVLFILEKKIPKGGHYRFDKPQPNVSITIFSNNYLDPESVIHLSPLSSSHLSARPFLVRPEITIGSKGSSVPEIVMPSGPLYLFSSTV